MGFNAVGEDDAAVSHQRWLQGLVRTEVELDPMATDGNGSHKPHKFRLREFVRQAA